MTNIYKSLKKAINYCLNNLNILLFNVGLLIIQRFIFLLPDSFLVLTAIILLIQVSYAISIPTILQKSTKNISIALIFSEYLRILKNIVIPVIIIGLIFYVLLFVLSAVLFIIYGISNTTSGLILGCIVSLIKSCLIFFPAFYGIKHGSFIRILKDSLIFAGNHFGFIFITALWGLISSICATYFISNQIISFFIYFISVIVETILIIAAYFHVNNNK